MEKEEKREMWGTTENGEADENLNREYKKYRESSVEAM